MLLLIPTTQWSRIKLMAPNFKDLLRKPLDDIERPKPIPSGTWRGIVKNWEPFESSQQKTPGLRFFIQPTGPGDDLDPAELVNVDLTKLRQMRIDFWLTDDSIYRLKDFMESCGVATTGRLLAEALPDLANAEVLLFVKQQQRNDRDGKPQYDSHGNPEMMNIVDSVKGTANL